MTKGAPVRVTGWTNWERFMGAGISEFAKENLEREARLPCKQAANGDQKGQAWRSGTRMRSSASHFFP